MAGLALPLARRRATAQLLRRPPGLSPSAIVRRLVAVQAQDIRTPGGCAARRLGGGIRPALAGRPRSGDRRRSRCLGGTGASRCRAALRPIGGTLVELDGGLLDLAAREPVIGPVAPRLHPAFDPLTADVAAALRDEVADVARFEDRLPA